MNEIPVALSTQVRASIILHETTLVIPMVIRYQIVRFSSRFLERGQIYNVRGRHMVFIRYEGNNKYKFYKIRMYDYGGAIIIEPEDPSEVDTWSKVYR